VAEKPDGNIFTCHGFTHRGVLKGFAIAYPGAAEVWSSQRSSKSLIASSIPAGVPQPNACGSVAA